MNMWFGLNGFVLETASSANFAFKDGFHYFDDISDEDCEDYSLCGSCSLDGMVDLCPWPWSRCFPQCSPISYACTRSVSSLNLFYLAYLLCRLIRSTLP